MQVATADNLFAINFVIKIKFEMDYKRYDIVDCEVMNCMERNCISENIFISKASNLIKMCFGIIIETHLKDNISV